MIPRALLFFACAATLLAQPADLPKKSQRAKQLMDAGQFSEAALLYRELVKALPSNAGLRMNLGMALHLAGDDRQALPQLETATRLEPSLAPASLFLGACHLALSEPAKAIGPLRRFLRAQPDHANALGMLGSAYEALAQREFEKLEKLAPDSAWLVALAAESEHVQGRLAGAFHLYRQVLAKSIRLRGIHAALAAIYSASGHDDWAAIEEQKDKHFPPADCRVEKLPCDFANHRFEELLSASRRLRTPQAYYWRTRAYNALADAAFSALARLPPSVEVHTLLAQTRARRGRHLEAAEQWRKALELAPGDARIERELAVSLRQSADYAGAELVLRKLVEQAPDTAQLNFMLGDVLLSQQRAEEALLFLRNAASDPAFLPAHNSLGRAYVQLGRAAEAIPHLRAALPQDKDGSVHYQLARALESSGQGEEARAMLAKSQHMRSAAEAVRKTTEMGVQITPP